MIKNKIVLTNKNGNIIDIDGVSKILVKRGENISNNYMSVTLTNAITGKSASGLQYRFTDDYTRESKYSIVTTKAQDTIDEEYISVYITDTDDPDIEIYSSEYLLFNGTINEIESTTSQDEDNISLITKDRNVVVLNRLGNPEAYSYNFAISSPLLIQRISRGACDNVPGVYGFDNNGNLVYSTGSLIDARTFTEGIILSGTVDSVNEKEVTDSSADFSSINNGDMVYNTTTYKYAYVTSTDLLNNSFTTNKEIFSSGDGYQISNGFIQDKRPDGTDFPDKILSVSDKPTWENISIISSTDYTNSYSESESGSLVVRRQMRCFIDRQNRLHWYYPDDTPSIIMAVGSNVAIGNDSKIHEIREVSISKKIDNAVNFIKYTAGKDFNNNSIQGYYYKDFTGTPYEQDAYRVYKSITDQLKNLAYYSYSGIYRQAQYDTSSGVYSYPNTSAYPFVPAFSLDGASVSNDSEYNTAFIARVKYLCINRAKSEIERLFSPLWSGTIKIQGEAIDIGELIDFTQESRGIFNLKLRVVGVQDLIDVQSNAWITTLTVKEDETEILQ